MDTLFFSSAIYCGAAMFPFIITLALLLRGKLSETRIALTALITCVAVSALVTLGEGDVGVEGVPLVIDVAIICAFVYIPTRLLYASKMKKQKCSDAAIMQPEPNKTPDGSF